MQFEITSEFIDSFKTAIDEKNTSFLKEQLNEFYAQDIAIIINQLNLKEAAYLFELIDDDIASDVLLELDEDKREIY
jgi:magnesium transporter